MFEYMFDTISQHPPTHNVKRITSPQSRRPPNQLTLLVPTGYSHSMVPGGLLVTSSTTRLTSATSLVIRVEIRSSTS